MLETIAILANSVKHKMHCVAGKKLVSKEWVRIVSDAKGGELSSSQATYQNPYGKYVVKPMQKIEMQLGQHVPLTHQPENFLISEGVWKQKYKIEPHELSQYLDHPKSIWGNGASVRHEDIYAGYLAINQSLYLVSVDNLNQHFDGYKRRATFEYNGIRYDLSVTDPNFEKIINSEMNHNNILCISLGENFNGNHYKIVASIL